MHSTTTVHPVPPCRIHTNSWPKMSFLGEFIVGGGGTTSIIGAEQSNPAATSSAHIGYQGSRRSAHRGRGTFRGRGGRLPPVWSGPTFPVLHFGTIVCYFRVTLISS